MGHMRDDCSSGGGGGGGHSSRSLLLHKSANSSFNVLIALK